MAAASLVSEDMSRAVAKETSKSCVALAEGWHPAGCHSNSEGTSPQLGGCVVRGRMKLRRREHRFCLLAMGKDGGPTGGRLSQSECVQQLDTAAGSMLTKGPTDGILFEFMS